MKTSTHNNRQPEQPEIAVEVATNHKSPAERLPNAADAEELCIAVSASVENGSRQSRSFLQKYGYAGSFKTIDEIYPSVFSSHAALKSQGEFCQAQGIPNAVSNRSAYFTELVSERLKANQQCIEVLYVASGSYRNIAEFFESHPTAKVKFTCVDVDERAIDHAKTVCGQWLDRITFIISHALNIELGSKFDLVWSSGRFDYFDDRGFVAMLLTRLISLAKPESARVVICNFINPESSATRQEIGDWFLNYRTPEQVVELALACSEAASSMEVNCKEENVDFLLRVSVGQPR